MPVSTSTLILVFFFSIVSNQDVGELLKDRFRVGADVGRVAGRDSEGNETGRARETVAKVLGVRQLCLCRFVIKQMLLVNVWNFNSIFEPA